MIECKHLFVTEKGIFRSLAGKGFSEVLTYNFIELFKKNVFPSRDKAFYFREIFCLKLDISLLFLFLGIQGRRKSQEK